MYDMDRARLFVSAAGRQSDISTSTWSAERQSNYGEVLPLSFCDSSRNRLYHSLLNMRLYTFSGVLWNTASNATSPSCFPSFPHEHSVLAWPLAGDLTLLAAEIGTSWASKLMEAGRDWFGMAKDAVDMTAFGLHRRQMFIMTSYVESREMKDAKVY